MPRFHRTETYDGQGNLLSVEEIPYTPEEELAADQEEEMNDKHEQAIVGLTNWASLTPTQKDTIFYHLIRWALWKDGRLPAGL